MIWLALIAGIIVGQFFPNQFREWVRGVAGKARGLVLGAAPASKVSMGISAEIPAGNEVRPTPPNKNIEIGRALANLASFLWRWKWAILVVCFFSLAVGLMRGCAGPLDFGKSRGQIALERELAEGEVEVREKIIDRDAAISEIRAELAAVRATLQANHQRGRDAIEAARPANEQPLDPSVVAAWRQSLDGLCVERADGSRADSCGPGTSPAL